VFYVSESSVFCVRKLSVLKLIFVLLHTSVGKLMKTNDT
jgi:hypothetical protein